MGWGFIGIQMQNVFLPGNEGGPARPGVSINHDHCRFASGQGGASGWGCDYAGG